VTFPSVRPGALGAVACLLLAACAGADQTGPRVGRAAPAYAGEALSGDTVSLESLRGNVVLLNLWATWCAPCRRETPFLQDLHEEWNDQGLEVVGVALDSPGARERVDAFVEEFGVTYTVLYDPQMRAMDLYRVLGLPGTFLVDREGTLVWMRFGELKVDDPGFHEALEVALR